MCRDIHKRAHAILVWKKCSQNTIFAPSCLIDTAEPFPSVTVPEAGPRPDPTTFTSHSKHPASANGAEV